MSWEWVVLILGIIWAIVPMFIAMTVTEYKLQRYTRTADAVRRFKETPRGENK